MNTRHGHRDDGLKSTLSTTQLLLYGVGTMVGAGIYVLVGKIAGTSGYLAPWSFLLAAILAGFTGLSYSELSSNYPFSAGEAHYIDKAFRKKWLATLTGGMVVLSGVVSAGVLINGFEGYFDFFFDMPSWAVICGVLILMTLIAIVGIDFSVNTIVIITLLEIVGLVFVILMSKSDTSLPLSDLMKEMTDFKLDSFGPMFIGAFLAFYAYIGFEDLVNISEEAKDPARSMRIAILGSLAISTILYILVSVASLSLMTPADLAASDAPFADLLASRGPGYQGFISVIGLVAIINGALVQLIMASRVIFGLARSGKLPSVLGTVNKKFNTPVYATLLIAGIILLLALSFDLVYMAVFASFVLILVFALVNLAAVRLKSQLSGPYPTWVNWAGFFLCLLFLVLKIVSFWNG